VAAYVSDFVGLGKSSTDAKCQQRGRNRDLFHVHTPVSELLNSRAAQICASDQYDNSVRDQRQWTVVVAMIAMRVVEASIDQIIDMVPMGNSLMAAARAMSMRLKSGSAML
jgi:hypothetical protein